MDKIIAIIVSLFCLFSAISWQIDKDVKKEYKIMVWIIAILVPLVVWLNTLGVIK
jgi:Ca2+/Na+ antiporter